MQTLAKLALALTVLAPAQVVEHADSKIRVQFDEIDGTSMPDFLKLMELQLGRAITYEPNDIADVRLLVIGAIDVERDEFRAFAETTLLSHGFLVVEYGPILVVRRSGGMLGVSKPGYIRSVAPFVPRDELMTQWKDRRQVVTTCASLESLRSIDALAMLQTYFTDPMTESIRHLEQANALVLTGHAEGLRQSLLLLDTLEHDAAASAARHADALESRVKRLEAGVASLEARLDKER